MDYLKTDRLGHKGPAEQKPSRRELAAANAAYSLISPSAVGVAVAAAAGAAGVAAAGVAAAGVAGVAVAGVAVAVAAVGAAGAAVGAENLRNRLGNYIRRHTGAEPKGNAALQVLGFMAPLAASLAASAAFLGAAIDYDDAHRPKTTPTASASVPQRDLAVTFKGAGCPQDPKDLVTIVGEGPESRAIVKRPPPNCTLELK